MIHQRSVALTLTVLFPILAVFYSNCSFYLRPQEEATNSVPSTGNNNNNAINGPGLFQDQTLCDQDLKVLFHNGYYQFTRTNCISCHNVGPGKGRFASDNPADAFNDFTQIGYAKISDNAVSDHKPPYTGPQHIPTINQLRAEWQQGLTDYSACSGKAPPTGTVKLQDILTLEAKAKLVPKVGGNDLNYGQTATLSWTINTEFTTLKPSVAPLNVAGASSANSAMFSLQVGKYRTSGGEPYYTFTQPRLYGAAVDLQIKTIQVKINGRLLEYPTTFRYVDKGIYSGSVATNANSLVSTGSLVAPGVLSASDMISVDFESIQTVTLPPPAPPVTVDLTGANMRWVNSTTGQAVIQLSLSRVADSPVTVTVSSDTSNICGGTTEFADVSACDSNLANFICQAGGCPSARTLGRARSVVGTQYNRFDWDYKFNSTAVVFAPGETTKNLTIEFSKDIRKENNRLFTVQIDPALLNAVRGTQDKIHFVIEKLSNPTPPVGVPTFTQLMQSTGVLGFNCVKCHNSRDLNGGYDMTNYDLMLSRGVVIPNNTNSLMFNRMNPSSPSYQTSAPMPIEGALPVEYRREVETWLLNGAYNN